MRKNKFCFCLIFVFGLIVTQAQASFANVLSSWQEAKAYKPKPVLFLHGFAGGNSQGWNSAITVLSRYFTAYSSNYTYLETMDFNDPNGSVDTYGAGKVNPQGNHDGWADKLSQEIDRLLSGDSYGVYTHKLNLFCHSMGGLAAREYIANLKYSSSGRVDKLILMGVPNKGTNLASMANYISAVPKNGWLTYLPALNVASSLRNTVDMSLYYLKDVSIEGEAADDMDPDKTGSGFIARLNNLSQPTDVSYYGIIGRVGHLLNWITALDYYGGDGTVSVDSQLGTDYVSLKNSLTIIANHEDEVKAIAIDKDVNRVLSIIKFLDSDKPEIEVVSPKPDTTTEIKESSIHITGKVYKEYLPADSKLVITLRRQEDGVVSPAQESLLKPSDLWIANNPDSPVAEFDEVVSFPGNGTYEVSCQVKNPAGVTSETKKLTVKVNQVIGVIIHCHNPEGKEINSITGVGNAAEIFDGNTSIGYGARDSRTHNVPFQLKAGSHRIRARFNGMELFQNLTVVAGKVYTVTFEFNRTEFDFKTYLDNIGTVTRSAAGTLSYPPAPSDKWNIFVLDNGGKFPWIEQGIAMHIYNREAITLNTTGYLEMIINRSGIHHRVWAKNSVTGGVEWSVGMGARFTEWDGRSVPTYNDMPAILQTNRFDNWIVQKRAVPGLVLPTYRCYFMLGSDSSRIELVDSKTYIFLLVGARTGQVVSIKSHSPCFFSQFGASTIFQASVPSNFYFSNVFCSSIPYDLDGRAI